MPNTEEETAFFLENRICIFLKLGKFHKKMLSWNWATFCKLWKKNCFSNLKREDFNVQCSWKASDVEHKEGEVRSGVILLNGFAIGAIRIYGHWIPPPSPNAFFCDKANYNVLQRVHLQQNFYQLQNCNNFSAIIGIWLHQFLFWGACQSPDPKCTDMFCFSPNPLAIESGIHDKPPPCRIFLKKRKARRCDRYLQIWNYQSLTHSLTHWQEML